MYLEHPGHPSLGQVLGQAEGQGQGGLGEDHLVHASKLGV